MGDTDQSCEPFSALRELAVRDAELDCVRAKLRALAEAARARVEEGHDTACPGLRVDDDPEFHCTCGHSALQAAIRRLDEKGGA